MTSVEAGSIHLMICERLTELLKDAGFLVADGLGSDAPLHGDLGWGLA